ncbi:MAG: nucleotide exchange factor GrpE [Chlorobi bacterium]|nr:MAG: co-chaperone GrpE [Chlorobi bacterium OLB7]MBK8912277.1 nucleotide exchange factor GrpE [Chlorobiota bacterium]
MQNEESPMNEQEREETFEGGEAAVEVFEQIAQLQQENQALREKVLRSVAEVDNVRRRSQQESQNIIQYANERLLRELLPVVDDINRSVEAGAQNKDFDSFYQGVMMVRDKVMRVLESQGVKPMNVVGIPFDLSQHEALLRQPSEAPEDTIVGEIETGYTYGDRVLRHAKVIVSAGS